VDLQDGQRGYVITGKTSFLAPWTRARQLIPDRERELASLIQDPDQRGRYDAISASVNHYEKTWAVPTVALARTNRAAVVRMITTGTGKHETDHIRSMFDAFLFAND